MCALELLREKSYGIFQFCSHSSMRLASLSSICIFSRSFSVIDIPYRTSPPNLKPPPNYDHIILPEKRKLPPVERQPLPPPGQKIRKMPKQLIDMRGPELVNNRLFHNQYGIRAKMGGSLKFGHFEMMRLGINRKLDESRMFAIWRVDPPWKPVTKRAQGSGMGGGKGAIHHYVTPVRAGRIIIEVGGHCDYEEVYPFLKRIAMKMPFKAEPVTKDMIDEELARQKFIEENNINPFTFQYCIENNMLGSKLWASPYDSIWHGKHR